MISVINHRVITPKIDIGPNGNLGGSAGFVRSQVLAVQCRMARAALSLSVRKLAAAARFLPKQSFASSEAKKIRPSTITSLRQVFEAAGVEFTNGRKPGVRLSVR